MMLTVAQIFEHSIALELVPIAPVFMDCGASNLPFSMEVRRRYPQSRVLAVEPNLDYSAEFPGVDVFRGAVVGKPRVDGKIRYAKFSVPIRNYITEADTERFRDEDAKIIETVAQTLPDILSAYHIDKLDVLKLDVEGAEFEILENLKSPIATQITVEFHDFKNRAKWDDQYFNNLLQHLTRVGYTTVQHEMTNFGSEESNGHWDSLFVETKTLRDAGIPFIAMNHISRIML